MDVFDSSFILEEFMNTQSISSEFTMLVNKAYHEISENHFDSAESIINEIADMCNNNNPEIAKLNGELIRSKFIYEKNN